MTAPPERRAVPRLALSEYTAVQPQTGLEARLLDLSLHGIWLGHRGFLRAGAPCALDLPATLGGAVRGHVVWCAVHGVAPTPAGEAALWANTGVQFTPLPAVQQAVLRQALRDLATWTAVAAPPAPDPE